MTAQLCALIPVGPATAEIGRLEALAESLEHHEALQGSRVLIVDDAPAPRDLAAIVRGATVIRTSHWSGGGAPRPFDAITAGTLAGLRVAAELGVEFVVKLDTDALVIAPFADAIGAAFAADRRLGVVGSYDRTCNGGTRDWSVWDADLARAVRSRDGEFGGPRARIERCIAYGVARLRGYRRGEHCLGGAYAVSGGLLSALRRWRPHPWLRSDLSEDVVLGLLCRASGFRMRSLVGVGDPFGLAHTGLPGDPEWLVSRGHSIIHSLKAAEPGQESATREHFKRLDGRGAPGST